MATAKIEIEGVTHSRDELATILRHYSTATLKQYKKLYGGYSGSNYLIELDDNSIYVLKIAHGYSKKHAEKMCRTGNHVNKGGFSECCLPIPKLEKNDGEYTFITSLDQSTDGGDSASVPAFLLTFCKGTQADKVMRERPELSAYVMENIGGGLARMHKAASGLTQTDAVNLGLRWFQDDGGGCCDVQTHVDDKALAQIVDICDSSPSNPKYQEFLAFYNSELKNLKEEMTSVAPSLLHGITHGYGYVLRWLALACLMVSHSFSTHSPLFIVLFHAQGSVCG